MFECVLSEDYFRSFTVRRVSAVFLYRAHTTIQDVKRTYKSKTKRDRLLVNIHVKKTSCSPPSQQAARGPEERAAADGQEQRPDADVPEDAPREASPLERALLTLQQLVVVRVATADAGVARQGGRARHNDTQWSAEVMDHNVKEGCTKLSALSACDKEAHGPGTVNVLRKASTKKTSQMVRDTASDSNDKRNDAINRMILETGRFVLRRIARGTGSAGTVAKIDGMPSMSVMTDSAVQQSTTDFGGSCVPCKAS